MKKVESLLAEHPFTKNMNIAYLEKIAGCASQLDLMGGKYVFRQGESAQEFYLILSGSVEIELFSAIGGPVVLEKIGGGSVLGWSWLISPYRWHFDARTVEPVSALKIDAVRLRNLEEFDGKFGYEILKRFLEIIGDRLESERTKLVDLYAAHS